MNGCPEHGTVPYKKGSWIDTEGRPRGAQCTCAVTPSADALWEQVREAQALVNEQAEDDGLWFIAEGYFQQEVRRLHAAVEAIDFAALREQFEAAERERDELSKALRDELDNWNPESRPTITARAEKAEARVRALEGVLLEVINRARILIERDTERAEDRLLVAIDAASVALCDLDHTSEASPEGNEGASGAASPAATDTKGTP